MSRPAVFSCRRLLRVVMAATIALAMIPAPANGEIRFGMSAALTGPAEALGQQMRMGIDACFAIVNEAGGVHGEPLRLIVRDDGYEPARAAPNMRALIHEDKVTAVIGNVGTPTAIVTVPIANANRTLLFGAYTGGDLLRRTPPDRYVINYRASDAEETAAMIDYLLRDGVRPEEIAFFTQRDGFGDNGYRGAIRALNANGFTDTERLVHARYTRNTTNVEDALAQLLDSPVTPRAVIMVGGYLPSAKFIKLARRELPALQYLHVSFGGSGALLAELGPDGDGVIVTQVVPSLDSDLPMVADYRRDMARYAPGEKTDYISLEGYIVARLAVEAIRRAGPAVDSERIIDAFEQMRAMDVGLGLPIGWGPASHQATSKVWLTRIQGGRYVKIPAIESAGASRAGRPLSPISRGGSNAAGASMSADRVPP